MFGMRVLFRNVDVEDQDRDVQELLKLVDEYEAEHMKGRDPVAMHKKPTCRIEEGPKIRGKDGKMESYQMCKTCCREVHFIGYVPTPAEINLDSEDDCGALMF